MRLMVMVMIYYYDGFYDGAVCYDGDGYDYVDGDVYDYEPIVGVSQYKA
jgi:hypothetical protein